MPAQHKPGPWRIAHRYEEYDDEGNSLGEIGHVGRIENAKGQHICGTCDGCNKIDIGDARLIAAAPDLLAALKECRDMLRAMAKAEPEVFFGFECLEPADEAIAKAEGRQP